MDIPTAYTVEMAAGRNVYAAYQKNFVWEFFILGKW